MIVMVSFMGAVRTGRRILPSTARLAVIAAAILQRPDLDELVLEAEPDLLEERLVGLSPDPPTL
jgi:hypothetical protein